MSKVTCHAKGNLFIKCKNCGYSWNTPVIMNQEVDDKCSNCLTENQFEIVFKPNGTAINNGAEIPEFMEKPLELLTIESHQYHHNIREHYKGGRRVGISLGFKSGLIWGLLIGLIILGIVLAILFVPINMY